MSTKVFLSILVGVLLFGGSIGGAFVGGMTLGKSRAEANAPATAVLQRAQPGLAQGAMGSLTQEQMQQMRQQFQQGGDAGSGGGVAGPTFGQGTQGGDAANGAGSAFAGRLGGLVGTIQAVEGDTLTVDTGRGTVRVTIGPDTAIRTFTTGAVGDLHEGEVVTFAGSQNDEGGIDATAVLAVPPEAEGLLGGGMFRTVASPTATP